MVEKEEPAGKIYEIALSENALKNIDEITGYIAFINHQPLNAIKIGNAFFELFERINEHPFAFKECPYILTKTKMYRQALCYNWLVIFKVVGNFITILGILHTSRKPSKIKSLRRTK